ncbi:bifunctional hydroxymethylpyrimidine kinase/phosphomethylpyrimidine kinase, partial [Alphaproteobacteria bacterium]|nr:bifunctional hydroxymethylpyrimidine kinase/phosphomethylpyrimidine kinase [Alphaproteobacteria bacterium]
MNLTKLNNLQKTVLVIAGSDPSGGAGIQADLKTLTSFGVYGMTAITALTEQNTNGVFDILEIPIEFVVKQINCCLSDINANAVKIGMLHSADLISAVLEALFNNNIVSNKKVNIVLDPVMVAKGGHKLLKENAIDALKNFIKVAQPILTPNIPEAEILTGIKINNLKDMKNAGKEINNLGASHVILKGGHMKARVMTDLLINSSEIHSIETSKIITNHTHGTGCTMASALSASLAKSIDIRQSFEIAHKYVNNAIKTNPKFGRGNGPINHCFNI